MKGRAARVDSDKLPLPWRGRLGYACLNTVLRNLKDPIFCSRTCRIAQLADPKGKERVLELGRQNASDLSKMIQWNERFGIRFMRISSEMFPFASHPEHGYHLNHADAELKAAGELAMRYGHRLTMHPGQFTQIASTNPNVFENAERDLEHHAELLTRLGLTGQADRDAVMIIHLGGVYGDKTKTLERFRTNYARLSEGVRKRLVLENDDVSWTVEDILPLCEEEGIPMVLDWHHHFVKHGSLRPGSADLVPLLPRINKTWEVKGITPKQHVSEPKVGFPKDGDCISDVSLRGHSARIKKLPPCGAEMDLMIEAKDKEQAIFEIAKIYGLDNPCCPKEIVDWKYSYSSEEGYWPEGEEERLKPPKRVRTRKKEGEEEAKEKKKKRTSPGKTKNSKQKK